MWTPSASRRFFACWALSACALFAGCTSINVDRMAPGSELPLLGTGTYASESTYVIRPGDDLQVKFFYTPELNEAVKVRPDGFISLQLVDEVRAAGLTPAQLDDELTTRYAKSLDRPNLSVIVRSFQGHRAYVGGEVAVPQTLNLDGGLSVLQAIYAAGGTLPTSRLDSVVLVRKGEDGRPLTYHLDLSEGAMSDSKVDSLVALKPSDIVYVPRTPIANANRWVQQYIVDLLLFKGVQLGFSHTYVYGRGNNDVGNLGLGISGQ